MKKLFILTIMLVFAVVGIASATTFVAEGNVYGSVNGTQATVVLSGKIAQDAIKLIRYRDFKGPNGWTDEISIINGKAAFDASEGNTFQLVNSSGHFVLLTQTMVANQKYGKLNWNDGIGLVDPAGRGFCFYLK